MTKDRVRMLTVLPGDREEERAKEAKPPWGLHDEGLHHRRWGESRETCLATPPGCPTGVSS